MPIRNRFGQIIGVAMFAADLTDLGGETQVTTIGERGYTYLVDAGNQALAHPDPAFTAELRDLTDYPPVAALRRGEKGLIVFTDENGESWHAFGNMLDNGWPVIAQRPRKKSLRQPANFSVSPSCWWW
jgi:hypothetical protein